jgi:hypothetical protein
MQNLCEALKALKVDLAARGALHTAFVSALTLEKMDRLGMEPFLTEYSLSLPYKYSSKQGSGISGTRVYARNNSGILFAWYSSGYSQ